MKVCALIPAYNEGRFIASVIKQCLEQNIEVLVVDDCSSDDTAKIAKEAGAKVVSHEVNSGKGVGLHTGIKWAEENGFDAVVALDGDGQHDPSELSRIIACQTRTGADMVIGSRFLRHPDGSSDTPMPRGRKFINWIMSVILSWLAGAKVTDTQSGYRLISVRLWNALSMDSVGFDTESEMIVDAAHLGFRVAETPVRTIYGDEVSAINPFFDTITWLGLVIRMYFQKS